MATRQEEARQSREARLDELHEKLTGAVERLVTGNDWADALRFAARGLLHGWVTIDLPNRGLGWKDVCRDEAVSQGVPR